MSEKHANTWYGVGDIVKSNRMEEGFELRFLDSGTPMLKINLCVNDEWQNGSGEVKTRKTYVPLVAWGQKAEEYANIIRTGATIKVKAEYRQSSFDGEDGKVYTHDFNVYSLEVVDGQAQAPRQQSRPAPQERETPAPSQPVRQEPQQEASAGNGEEVDDIPF